MHFYQECQHYKFKFFSLTWWSIQARKNQTSILERDKALRSLKKYERMFTIGCNLGVDIFLKKREHQKKGTLKQTNKAPLYTQYWGFKKIQCKACLLFFFGNKKKSKSSIFFRKSSIFYFQNRHVFVHFEIYQRNENIGKLANNH